MPEVQIEPTKEHPIPYDLTEEKPTTLMDEIAVAGNTAELQESLGAELDVSEGDTQREKELLDAVANAKKPSNLTNQSTAFAAATFLRTYGQQLAMDAVSALELLGKHSDIGIFTERSEITVNYSNPEDLEKAIKDRVKTLLNATVVDTIPLSQSLDEELGLLDDLDDDLDDEEDKDDESDISV